MFQVFFPFKPTVDAEIAPAFPLSPCSAEQGEDHQSLGGNPSEKVNTYEYIIYTWLKTHENPYNWVCVYIYIGLIIYTKKTYHMLIIRLKRCISWDIAQGSIEVGRGEHWVKLRG